MSISRSRSRSSDCIQARPNTFVEGVPKFWQNFLRWFFTWKYWYLALQHIFKSLGLGKNAKNPKKGKTGFWGKIGYNSKTVRSIFLIFWHKTPITNAKRLKFFFFKNFFHFRENINFAKIEISQKPGFCFSWNSKLKYPKA